MPKTMIDEYHLRLFVPANLTSTQARAIRRVIDSKRFQAGLRQSIQHFCHQFPSLKPVTIKLAA